MTSPISPGTGTARGAGGARAPGTIDRRYRLFWKPLLFLACLTSLLLAAGGVLGAYGLPPQRLWQQDWFSLGVDPARRLLGIFGKSTLNLLLLTLAVTPLRQLSGNSQLLRLRRMLGVFAFAYALLHFATYIGPFSGFDWQAITRDLYKRPYITLGFAALLLLVPLAVTSTNAMMKRLKRRWQQLHRLIYVIALLGVWHYWWQVKKDISEPLLYAGMLAVLLGWRLVRRLRARGSAADRLSRLTSRCALPRVRERSAA